MALAFGEVQEQVGGFLLPVMTKLTDIFVKYQDLILPIGATLVGLVLAVKAYELAQKAGTVVTQAVTAAQWLWNAAISANPIMLIVIALVAVVAAVILDVSESRLVSRLGQIARSAQSWPLSRQS